MLKDLEQLKKQLAELAEVINSFKSEAVQLKIIEFIFKGGGSGLPRHVLRRSTRYGRCFGVAQRA